MDFRLILVFCGFAAVFWAMARWKQALPFSDNLRGDVVTRTLFS